MDDTEDWQGGGAGGVAGDGVAAVAGEFAGPVVFLDWPLGDLIGHGLFEVVEQVLVFLFTDLLA